MTSKSGVSVTGGMWNTTQQVSHWPANRSSFPDSRTNNWESPVGNNWQPDGQHYQMASVGTAKRSTAWQVNIAIEWTEVTWRELYVRMAILNRTRMQPVERDDNCRIVGHSCHLAFVVIPFLSFLYPTSSHPLRHVIVILASIHSINAYTVRLMTKYSYFLLLNATMLLIMLLFNYNTNMSY